MRKKNQYNNYPKDSHSKAQFAFIPTRKMFANGGGEYVGNRKFASRWVSQKF